MAVDVVRVVVECLRWEERLVERRCSAVGAPSDDEAASVLELGADA